jgi:pyruvate dehydrogenase E2 component (dihydrolipoamide acetyltransferase)
VAVEIKLPRLGQGMESGTIVRWLKGEGDEVAKGEPLYELDTDKVTQEVEADASGTLLKIVVTAGEVGVGATVAVVGAPGEDVSALLAASPGGNGGASAAAPASSAETPPVPSASGPPGEPAAASAAPALRADDGGRVKASPLARRIARERGLDLAVIAGTGPDGRVIAVDVEQASGTRAAGLAAGGAGWAGGAGGAGRAGGAGGALQGPTVVELTSTRRTIARRLTEAWQAPVFQLVVTADATQLVATRERLVELMREGDVKPTVSDVLTRLVASALVRHPAVNAHFVDGRILRFPQANVGLAVAAPSGLVVPVVRGAGHLSVQEIATVRADLVSRAREGRLQLADLEDGTFTISNLGMYAIEQFVAVLNPPQVAILAVGSIEDRPTARDGALVVAPTMTMTLTCDHRAIDGSEGAEFLRDLEAFVEQPALAL